MHMWTSDAVAVRALYSVAIGAGISVLIFIPLVVFQYRRYGRLSATRMLWLFAGVVYATAVVAYTIFPLPDLTKEWCAAHPDTFRLDPLQYFRDMAREHRGDTMLEWLKSWSVLQMVLNVALFVPLGVITRQLWDFGPIRATALGLALSLGIELTQYTGNWGLMRCAYRVADVNDLMTNTFGALVGALFAQLLPRMAADADELRASRGDPRPVTRGRRWAGMLLDVAFQAAGLVMIEVGAIGGVAVLDHIGSPVTDKQVDMIADASRWATLGFGLFLALVPALAGSGASLGQRIVYLRPEPGERWRTLLRACLLQGLTVVLVWAPIANAWAALAVLVGFASVAFTPRGLTGVLTGTWMADSREDDYDDAADEDY
jgi:glycopeptide antibiotics resistance protein